MSAATFHEGHVDTSPDEDDDLPGPEARAVGRPVVVRRNAGLAALVGAGASAIAIAYLWRATTSGAPADWALCAVMAALALVHLAQLVDARTPLLVADDLGMRIRLGRHWRGLPWDSVGTVVVQHRRGLLRDGRLVFDPQGLDRLEGLDGRGRRAAALNRRLYGAPLAVPLSLTTRVSSGSGLVEHLRALAGQRAEIVSGPLPAPPEPSLAAPDDDARDARDARDEEALPSLPTVRSAVQLRAARRGLRATVADETTSEPHPVDLHSAGPPQDDEGAGFGNVRPIAAAAISTPVVEAPVIDTLVQPATDPVIGPELAAARARVRLTVDELADRTRIRPHVIESIEVDDFAPCGGDFYARGHLRTLARVLGRDPAPLLAHFDRRYATAPIDARQVFEAELATGMTAASRRTTGGPNWALLVGVVLALVLTWGVVRLFAAEPPERLQSPVPSLDGSAGVDSAGASSASEAGSVSVALQGAGAGSPVVVRDRSGRVVWQGRLAQGEQRTLRVAPPADVRAEDAGGVQVSVDGQDQGTLGATGEPGRRVLQRPPGR